MNEEVGIDSRRLIVSGRVQGVSYRAWCVAEARRLGLAGWVRNRRDGTVELLIAGDPEAVAAMSVLCRDGPPLARVERVTVEDSDAPGVTGFEQRPTA